MLKIAVPAVVALMVCQAHSLCAQQVTFSHVWLSDAQIADLKSNVEKKVEPQISAWPKVLDMAEQAVKNDPQPTPTWYVPGYYKDGKGHQAAKMSLQNDANRAYAAALAWRITGESKYAQAATKNIMAWTTGVKDYKMSDDSRLSFSYHYPPMILAADLLKSYDGFSAAGRAAFADFLRTKALPMNCMSSENNWGNWGLVLVTATAAYLKDEPLMLSAEKRWKDFIDEQIADDGHMIHEVGRNNGKGDYGLWYSHFSLLPQTIGAEILRNNGMDLYNYKSPHGRSLELAYHRLAPWAENPASFPYFKGEDKTKLHATDYASYYELLYPRWPDSAALKLLQRIRPASATHGAPFLTFTHGKPLPNPQ